MKPTFILLILGIAGLFACNNDELLPLTPSLVLNVNAFDLGNDGNGGDIRVDFEVKNNQNVIEYRIMIVPEISSSFFVKEIAEVIQSESFQTIFPESFTVIHSARRLSDLLLDINGEIIMAEKDYVAAVLVISKDDIQLSESSVPFKLQNLPIYSGYYVVLMQDKI